MLTMVSPLEVGIACENLPALRKFYEKVLGMQFISEYFVPTEKAVQTGLTDTGYTVVRLQTPLGERIKLLSPVRPPIHSETSKYILDRVNACYLTFIVENLDSMIQCFLNEAVELITGETKVEVRPGVYLMFCKDPEGNVLELVEYEDLSTYRNDLNNRGN